MEKTYEVDVGRPLPLGTLRSYGGTNFALFSRHANKVWLELFDNPDAETPSASIGLDPQRHRTGDIWHVWVKGVTHGQCYGFRVEGPYQPEQGQRFNRHKLLLDPYAMALSGTTQWDFDKAHGYDAHSPALDLYCAEQDDARFKAKCLITDNRFDWEGDGPLKRLWSEMIIYETHVRGLTRHPSCGAKNPAPLWASLKRSPTSKNSV